MEERNIDSISNSNSIEEKNDKYIIDIEIPNGLRFEDTDLNTDKINNKKANKNAANIKKVLLTPGTKIRFEKSSYNTKRVDSRTNVKKNAVLKKEKVEKKKISQYVILAIIIAIFICLIVRYAKIVGK